MTRRVLALLLVVLLLGGCGDDGESGERPQGFASTLLRVLPAGLEWCVWLADTEVRRERGLMEVTDLGDRDGMLFAFDTDVTGRFWMRNTPMPLSIGFFAADGTLVSSTDMAPCADRDDCPTYAADGAYRWALEVPAGGLEHLGVLAAGARIDVTGERDCRTPRAD